MVQLKEFTWVQPSLGPRELLQAIESAIPVDAIETAIQQSQSASARTSLADSPGGGAGDCSEYMGTGFNSGCAQKPGDRVKPAVDSSRSALAGAQQVLD